MLPHENWKELKDYLNPRLTVTEAVNIFLASLKFGVKIIKKRHQELNPNCLLKAFIHKFILLNLESSTLETGTAKLKVNRTNRVLVFQSINLDKSVYLVCL